MDTSKGQGNLRDFRIDGRETATAAKPPRQTVNQSVKAAPVSRPRSSAQEWASPTKVEDLWPGWEEEVGLEVDLARPVAAAPQPAPPAPAEKTKVEDEGQLRTEPALGLAWSTELGLEERRMEREGVVDYSQSFGKQELLKARTREFTADLQDSFRESVELFNQARRSAAHFIHVYRVSKTAEDFMLFRNGVKLIVSGQKLGRIVFAFNQYMGQIFAPAQAPIIEVEAQWGPFDQLYWSYKSERVQPEDIVRYFMTEFARQSFR